MDFQELGVQVWLFWSLLGILIIGVCRKDRSGCKSGVLGGELMIEWGYEQQR